MSGPVGELYAGVQQAVSGAPYQVTPTGDGFEVSVDLPDRRWHSLFEQRGLRQVFKHRVKVVDEQARKLSVNDELYELAWSGGVAHLGASIGKQSGRIYRTSFGTSSTGDWAFGSEEGRRLVTDTAKQLGWTVVWSGAQKVGLVVGIIGGAFALVTLVGLLVALLAGAF